MHDSLPEVRKFKLKLDSAENDGNWMVLHASGKDLFGIHETLRYLGIM